MANYTAQQLQQLDAVVAGTHDRLDPNARMGPGFNSVADLYAGILPSGPTYETGMMGRGQPSTGSPYMTAAEKARLAQQVADSRALQAGYSPAGKPIHKAPVRLAGMFGRGLPATPMVAAKPITPLEKALAPNASLDDLLAYAKTIPDKAPVAAVNAMGQPTGLPVGGRPTSLSGMFAQPATIHGSSTGREYQVGQKGTAGGYTYEATPTGFVKTGADPSMAGMTAAQRYDTLNARAGNQTNSTNKSSSRDPESQARANYSMASSRY